MDQKLEGAAYERGYREALERVLALIEGPPQLEAIRAKIREMVVDKKARRLPVAQ